MGGNKLEKYLLGRIDKDSKINDLLRFPRFFEIETVNACNARCPMCTIDDWQRKTPTMKDGLFNKIVDELREHSDTIQRVSLYRDGEPLLDKKLPKRVQLLKDNGIKQVSIATNVSLLNEKRSIDLLESGIDLVIMSIDSLDKNIFESIRVRLDFDEVIENAKRFIELRDRISPNTRIWMRMIRQKSNIDEWPYYEQYWSKYLNKNDRIYYHNIFNWGGQLDGFSPVKSTYEPNLPCVSLWSLFVIFGDGKVPLCNVDYNNKFPLGDVTKSSIEEIWRSSLLNKYRDMHLGHKKDNISICQNCNVWDEGSESDDFLSDKYAEKISL
ncbi:MAG TPA: radical SAM protein [Candidatus Thioglobus sp.]|nr:radical SAM protein [Candidatus Thioglobus sp.]